MGKNGEEHTPASKTRQNFYYFILFFDKNTIEPYTFIQRYTQQSFQTKCSQSSFIKLSTGINSIKSKSLE